MRWTLPLALCLLAALPARAQLAQLDPPEVTRHKPGQLDLKWGAFGETKVYVVWRKLEVKGAEWRPLKEVEGLEFSDPTLLPDVGASYKVRPAGDAAETKAVGPIEALADLYVELVSTSGTTARLFVHQWRPTLKAWVKSQPAEVKPGDTIKAEDVVGDFDTGVKVLKIGVEPPSEGEDPRGFMKVLTADKRLVKVVEGVKPPREVWQPPEKKKPEEEQHTAASKPKDPPPVAPVRKGRPIKFPQPTAVGPNAQKGDHVEWEIVNKSRFLMHFVITGKSNKSSYNFKVEADTTVAIKIKRGGDYVVTVNAIANEVVPLEGEFGLLAGTRYRSEFGVKTLDESDPRVKQRRGP
ncbi:MAG: hypothetical protein AB7N76_28045 [Planctomycetota bacterium]